MRLGLYGGSFNPIHLGHLLLAERAREELKLDRIMFIPCDKTVYNKELISIGARHNLIVNTSNFSMADIEGSGLNSKYTIDMVKYVAANYPGDELFLILGPDCEKTFRSWKKYEELIKLITPCFAISGVRHPRHHTGINIEEFCRFDIPKIEIRSTDIRLRIKEGLSIKYMVPENIREAIIELYKE